MNEIKEVLELLEHDDDDQWTEDGLPKVGLVKSMIENDAIEVNRETITNADPHFKRGGTLAVDADSEEEDAPEMEVEAPLSRDEMEVIRQDYFDIIEQETAKIAALTVDSDKLLAQIKSGHDKINSLINERDTKAPPMSPIEAVQRLNANNQRVRANRARGGLNDAMAAGRNKRPVFISPAQK